MISAVFAGSFDPPTFGHLNVIERASRIFEILHVVIAVNPQKKNLFDAEERFSLMKDLIRAFPNVSLHLCETLIVDFTKKLGAKVLVRGVRGVTDFSYEFDLSILNKGLNPGIETIFIPTDPRYFVIKSSAIKDLAAFDGDVSQMVPESVALALKRKLREGKLSGS
jgi:pantetheine-phosphate adenylyltransferase